MERKVTVLRNTGANQVEIQSTATTLSELKAEMTAAGIDYDGMSFYEGYSKTELLDDASILPSNLTYKGQLTNDLVILLSVKDKKIVSGATTREAVYVEIRKNNLQEDIKKEFGCNYTLISTAKLAEFVENKLKDVKVKDNTLMHLFALIAFLIKDFWENGKIEEDTYNVINKIFGNQIEEFINYVNQNKQKLSEEEINEIFGFLNKL